MIFPDNKAYSLSDTIIELHLGHAIEQMHKANQLIKNAKTGFEKDAIIRSSLSSILHSFCAMESAVNMTGQQMFNNPISKNYFPENKRTFTLTKFINSWNNNSILDKIFVILECSSREHLSKKLESQLREFNLIRNWIAHGFSYVRTLSLEETESPDSYNITDVKGDIDWKSKFPNTKFNKLRKLTAKDAQTALKITVEILKLMSEISQQPFSFMTNENKGDFHLLWKENFINPDFLEFK